MAYGLLENWPLGNIAGDSKQPEQKEQRQGNDRNHPKEGRGEGRERKTEAGNNTRAPFQVGAEDRRGRSGAVASENLTDPCPGEKEEEESQMFRKELVVESHTKSS